MQPSTHWTFSSGPFLDPTFSVRNKKTETFQRDHLLHNKEATCCVHVGKGSIMGRMMGTATSPSPLESSKEKPLTSDYGEERQQTKRSVCYLHSRQAEFEPQSWQKLLGSTVHLFKDKGPHLKDMRCVAHFKIRRAEYYPLYDFLSDSQKCIIYIKGKGKNDGKS